MPTITVAAGQRSDAFCVCAGTLVTVRPASGATATVEYTNGSASDVANNTATWLAWPKGGTLTVAATDIANENVFFRVTAASGVVTILTDPCPVPTSVAPISMDWRSQSDGMVLLARSAVAASVTGTTSETTLATVNIPAGAMGPNGGIEVRTVWTVTNSVNNKTPRFRLGGLSGTAFFGSALTTVATFSDARRVRNRNSTSSQVGSANVGANSVGSSAGALVTGTIDTSVAQDLVITGQLALGTETITLESYEVWLLA